VLAAPARLAHQRQAVGADGVELLQLLDRPVAVGRQRARMHVPFDAFEIGRDILKIVDERLLRPVVGAQAKACVRRQAERVDEQEAVSRVGHRYT